MRRSEVIIVGTARKRRIADRAFGRTVDYVLDHAPCEVLLNLVPKGYPGEGTGDAEGGTPGAVPAAVVAPGGPVPAPEAAEPFAPPEAPVAPEVPGDVPTAQE